MFNITTSCGDNARDGQDAFSIYRERLAALSETGNALANAGTLDDLCRQAVWRGQEFFGGVRLGLWFRKDKGMLVCGSFGTDENGALRDERSQLLTAGPSSPIGQVLGGRQRLYVNRNCVLRDDKGRAVGKGTLVVAAMRKGSEIIGCICADNLNSRVSFDDTDCELLSLYALCVGNLAFAKRTADELAKSVREKEILLREFHHRVKNNLQIISSLLSLQAPFIRDQRDTEMFRQTQSRIRSMAKVYDAICLQPADVARISLHDYINLIITDLCQSCRIDPSAFILRWEGQNETLPLPQAIPCSLIINELLTNALKHGIKNADNQATQVRREITISIARMDRNISITIGNDGAVFPAGIDIHHPLSLGLQLVNVLVSQMNGTLDLNRTRGTRFTVSFPIEEAEAER